MNLTYRDGTKEDLLALQELAIKSWSPFQKKLTDDNWKLLNQNISNSKTYEELLEQSTCIVCVADNGNVVGMAFWCQTETQQIFI